MLKKNKYVCILNYGSGNITSVYNAIKFLGYKVKVSNNVSDVRKASHLILPGVGSFQNSMSKVKENLPIKLINELVLKKNKPFLGICVGMQVLATLGYEFKKTKGLNYVKGEVVKIKTKTLKLPHIGWNKIYVKEKISLLNELNEKDFYFVHSYYFKCKYSSNIVATSKYKINFPAIIFKDKIFGVQFHPEKSQINGLKLLDNFIRHY
tara:strand:- start:181 stop:804 length:624 start_codon:yes stop_codon:yes gene_type:complete